MSQAGCPSCGGRGGSSALPLQRTGRQELGQARKDPLSGGRSLFSDLSRLMFHGSAFQRVKGEIRARAFIHLFTLLPNEKRFIGASTLDTGKSRE